jgi:hypothetical protein
VKIGVLPFFEYVITPVTADEWLSDSVTDPDRAVNCQVKKLTIHFTCCPYNGFIYDFGRPDKSCAVIKC